ncbi:MAG: hypothetical protein GXZ00_06705 [Synergistaceae bacterium]|nr:hypothetical protein [Synergistaceae bacterium]
MKLRTAKIINKLSKIFFMFALAGLVYFLVAYFRGSIEFKYFSLPVMACLMAVTWMGMSKIAVKTIDEDNNGETGVNDHKA